MRLTVSNRHCRRPVDDVVVDVCGWRVGHGRGEELGRWILDKAEHSRGVFAGAFTAPGIGCQINAGL